MLVVGPEFVFETDRDGDWHAEKMLRRVRKMVREVRRLAVIRTVLED